MTDGHPPRQWWTISSPMLLLRTPDLAFRLAPLLLCAVALFVARFVERLTVVPSIPTIMMIDPDGRRTVSTSVVPSDEPEVANRPAWLSISDSNAMFANSRAFYPMREVTSALSRVVTTSATLTQRLISLLQVAILITLWSIVGIAIARSVAGVLASEDPLSVPRLTQWGFKRARSGVGAQLLPLSCVALLCFGLALIGLASSLPMIGTSIGTLVSPLSAIFLLLTGLFLCIAVIGWPLMLAAVGVDDPDAFNAFSRTFNYITTRPWHFALYVLVASVVCQLTVWAAWCIADVGINFGGGLLYPRVERPDAMSAAFAVVNFALASFAVTVFWTAAALVYLLMRQTVDLVPITAGPLHIDSEDTGAFPVAGVRAPVHNEVQMSANTTSPAAMPETMPQTAEINKSEVGDIGIGSAHPPSADERPIGPDDVAEC